MIEPVEPGESNQSRKTLPSAAGQRAWLLLVLLCFFFLCTFYVCFFFFGGGG